MCALQLNIQHRNMGYAIAFLFLKVVVPSGTGIHIYAVRKPQSIPLYTLHARYECYCTIAHQHIKGLFTPVVHYFLNPLRCLIFFFCFSPNKSYIQFCIPSIFIISQKDNFIFFRKIIFLLRICIMNTEIISQNKRKTAST